MVVEPKNYIVELKNYIEEADSQTLQKMYRDIKKSLASGVTEATLRQHERILKKSVDAYMEEFRERKDQIGKELERRIANGEPIIGPDGL